MVAAFRAVDVTYLNKPHFVAKEYGRLVQLEGFRGISGLTSRLTNARRVQAALRELEMIWVDCLIMIEGFQGEINRVRIKVSRSGRAACPR